MIRGPCPCCCWRCFLAIAPAAAAQQQEPLKNATGSTAADDPVANPGRPTVSTPATLTPVGYFQFETGFLAAWNSPEVSSQDSLNEVIKFSVSRWIELLASTEPFAHSRASDQPTNAAGDVDLGVQGIIHHGEGAKPTIAVSYFGRVYSGDAPDLDIGSSRNSVVLLVSADVKGFHYDTNYSSTKSLTARCAGRSSGRRSRCRIPSARSSESRERSGISPSLFCTAML